jgi:hypothetical protein
MQPKKVGKLSIKPETLNIIRIKNGANRKKKSVKYLIYKIPLRLASCLLVADRDRWFQESSY